MIRQRLYRLAAISAAVALMLTVVGPVGAATPNWDITFVQLPPTVAPGNDTGYRITVSNNGPSNINALSVSVTPLDTPAAPWTYFSGLSSGAGPCSSTPPLTCELGTLTASTSVTFTVAYNVPESLGGSFDLEVAIRAGTGDTGSDGKGKSRGDARTESTSTTIDASDFDGGFFQSNTPLQTNPDLGRRNKQATSLDGYAASATTPYDVMISDGTTSFPTDPDDPNFGLACTGAACSSAFGEWSFINLKEGLTQGAAFHVSLLVLGSSVPNTATEATVDLIHVYYVVDANGDPVLDEFGDPVQVTDVIGDQASERCTFNAVPTYPDNPECVRVTKVGGNYRIDAWLFHNGAGRGGF